MWFVQVILALFGFAPAEVQAKIPPVFGYMSIFPLAYFASPVGSHILRVAREYFHPAVEWGLIAVALVSSVLVWQGFLRVVFFRDTRSWLGGIRRVLVPDS